jgi:DNA repair protein RadA/Sms
VSPPKNIWRYKMASSKNKTVYICTNCGYESIKWAGKCPNCGNWNTLEETVISTAEQKVPTAAVFSSNYSRPVTLDNIPNDSRERYVTGISEFDRVLGGGIVKGSLVLLSGDPGIGKSTLLLQICNYLGKELSLLYVSGEESAQQIKMRAKRLSVTTESLKILTETDMQYICEQIKQEKPGIVMIDSIQTMNLSDISSLSGSVTQVRECTNYLLRVCKNLNIPVILVGHVNKDGAIAGPKVLEHIVDAVLYFEGDKQQTYRILRAEKNRFGSTNEIGVFEMSEDGLVEISNPSGALLEGRLKNSSGTCITAVMEGTRPILAEIQGLASSSSFGNPRRMATGYDYNRVSLILAVLEKRSGFFFSNLDIYVNVVGGLKLDEPSVDLSVALALISSLKDTPMPEDVVAFGEIGLAGELRTVNNCESRISEAERLGFKKCILPYYSLRNIKRKFTTIELVGARTVREAYQACL